ncbi:hypothetical protein F8O01_12335 [Pseudoclavibacter chungangensis]|uniref:Uncharacterized protein n=1 Tax=Pseudoclavibacter chungangensis TaxID=587635 RepID=A0A7J5BQA6_9MICO|nr:hypothetical protein [Pseudoclavibacter chungangensis]KAB1655049.1 hypothetical protein F8O01_12335 [Pseudoclavibacter chungangensis]
MDDRVEEHVEGLRVVRADLAVFVDVDLGEERLVAQASGVVVASFVDRCDVAEQTQCVVQVRFGVGVVAVVCGDAVPDLFQLGPNAVLLEFEDVEWDGVGEVSAQQLGLLCFQRASPRG